MSDYRESGFEEAVLDYFEEIGWQTAYGPSIGPDGANPERTSYADVLLEGRLREAISNLNPELPADALDQAIASARRAESQNLLAENYRWHQMLVEGVPVSYRGPDGGLKHDRAKLIDLRDATNNTYLAVNQYRVVGPAGQSRRADVVAFINGIPLGFLELKRGSDEHATLKGAWNQLQTYKGEITQLLEPNAVCLVSDGVNTRAGSVSAGFEFFTRWRTVDAEEPEPDAVPQMKVAVHGIFDQSRILELIEFFIDWGGLEGGLRKRLARYNQYWGVVNGVAGVIRAMTEGDRKGGIIFQGQGSGKSMELVLIANRLMRMSEMDNPTIVVLSDRNDLDDSLFDDEFAPSKILPETPVQAESRTDLRRLLNRDSGGIIVTTLHKFGIAPGDRDREPLISDRSNIVVMADEAHRSQYGLAKGLAADMRVALPNATYLAATGTPVELADRSTTAVFGEQVSVYTPARAVEDGAVVPIYYQSRVAKIRLSEEAEAVLDRAIEQMTDEVTEDDQRRAIREWSRIEAILSADPVIERIVDDALEHWDKRRELIAGKAMLVGMSRSMAAKMYDKIVERRPDWHHDDDDKGKIKVAYTGSAADEEYIRKHVRSSEALRKLKARAKDPKSDLEMVVVCDLWLTGFDSPALHTMYLAKLMKGHGLFQAVTRPNRVYKDKPAGLIVSYVPVLDALNAVVAQYAKGDQQAVGASEEAAVKAMLAKHDAAKGILAAHAWKSGPMSPTEREAQISAAAHFLSEHPDEDNRFKDVVLALARLFSIWGVTDEARRVQPDVEFFIAVRAARIKLLSDTPLGKSSAADLDTTLSQLVAGAVEADEIIDVYAEAGMEQPEISLLSEDTLAGILSKRSRNLQIELLRKVLKDQIHTIQRKNFQRGSLFSERLAEAILRYQNRTITDAEIVAELVEMAKQLRDEPQRHVEVGLSEAEMAFYDAVIQNQSALLELGDDVLKEIARELFVAVRKSATLDWRDKQTVRDELRRRIRTLLKNHDYPPDKQEGAAELVVKQAELFADELLVA